MLPMRGKTLALLVAALVTLPLAVVGKRFRERDPATVARLKLGGSRWFNPWLVHLAGRRSSPLARLEHRGRTSGRLYTTPLWAEPVSEGFVIPLTYGRDVDWAHNLLRAESGVLQIHNVRYRVGHPRIVPVPETAPELPSLTRAGIQLAGIQDVLRLDVLPSLTAEVSPPA
jgi:deazaflavin-dependent oxidoreductase (nitroreductase family)